MLTAASCQPLHPGLLPDRLTAKIEVDGEGHWLWTAAKVSPTRYGFVRWDGRMQNAHRVVYGLLVRPIPDRRHLARLCSVRHCVNPQHWTLRPTPEEVRHG